MPRRTPPPADVADPTTDYARGVGAGVYVAGPTVRDACARHLRDLDHGPGRGLTFDRAAAARAISFFPDVLRLNGGQFEGKPFVLLPWQAFIVGSLFGWKGADGFRRFRQAFVLTGKGSGKSPLAAGVGLLCLTSDGEPRAEVYAAASMRDQAMVLFRDAVAMVNLSPPLKKRIVASGGTGREWNLAHIESGSWFRVIASGDGQSGPRPSCALLDEIHEHPDNTMVEMMQAGTKFRRQPLMFAITNAESDRTGVCAELRDYAEKVCAGTTEDDSFFAYVAALDPGDDPFADESCWGKPNPSLGHTIQPDYLRRQVAQARGMPSKAGIVRRLHFCEPTDAFAPWIDRDLWDAAEADVPLSDLEGLPCYGGLDLSAKRDLTSLGMTWVHPDGRLTVGAWFWTPGDTLEERARTDKVPYSTWRDAGHLFAPPGRMVDKARVASVLRWFSGRHDLRGVAFDQALIEDFERGCDEIGLDAWIDDRKPDADGTMRAPPGKGLRLVRHGQGFAGYQSVTNLWMPRSISTLEERIVAGEVTIRRNPVLRWNSASAVLQSDAQGNRKWDKRKATGRIDGMVAVTMGVGLATAPVAADPGPVAEGVWIM